MSFSPDSTAIKQCKTQHMALLRRTVRTECELIKQSTTRKAEWNAIRRWRYLCQTTDLLSDCPLETVGSCLTELRWRPSRHAKHHARGCYYFRSSATSMHSSESHSQPALAETFPVSLWADRDTRARLGNTVYQKQGYGVEFDLIFCFVTLQLEGADKLYRATA
jgi:hypothetical protein